MAKYMRKPQVVEAIQWNGDNIDVIKDFVGKENVIVYHLIDNYDNIYVMDANNIMHVYIHDYIVKHKNGVVKVMNHFDFEKDYQSDNILNK